MRLITTSASSAQLGQLVSLAAAQSDTASLRTLLTVSAERSIVPDADGTVLMPLLTSEDVLLRQTALTAVGQWKVAAAKELLSTLLVTETTDPADRLAAIRGITRGKDPQLLQTVGSLVADAGNSVSLRRDALV